MHRDFDGAIDGHVANVIAAYLEDRLDESEREVFEGELANSPDLLNTTIAARWAQGETPRASEVSPPRELLDWAKDLHSGPAPRGAARPRLRGRMSWFFRPGIVVATATVLLALIGGVGVYLSREDGTRIAALDRKLEPSAVKRTSGEIGRSGNSIFSDPKKVFFDGLDLE